MTTPNPNPSIVIHGPQGSAKGANAQRLRRHFGLAHVIADEADYTFDWRKPIPPATLILVDEAPPESISVRVLTMKEAMRLAGFHRSPATA